MDASRIERQFKRPIIAYQIREHRSARRRFLWSMLLFLWLVFTWGALLFIR
jgi:hypothetical protein